MSCHKQKFNKFSVFIAGFHSLHSSLVINIKFEWCSCLRPLSPETVWAEIVVEADDHLRGLDVDVDGAEDAVDSAVVDGLRWRTRHNFPGDREKV